MSKPIALIFGAGKNIGAATAQAFKTNGFRIAQVARSLDPTGSNDEDLYLIADLAHTGAVSEAFASVRKSWGEPSVVVYNAAAAHFVGASNPFTVSEEDFAEDLAVNTTSAYAAMKESVASFQTLPDSAAKMFLYTGNKLNTPGVVMPALFTLGTGKVATSHVIESAAQAYKDKGFRFYYVDQRTAEGGSVNISTLSGEGHAEFFMSLIEGGGNVPWLATFVKDKGYTKF
ncbi:hypothetical protein LTR85_011810 [Meristemomyces frigidus]|nr:hypothetical protein LTR85_011810 [Meristemomyces frigidus]